MDADSVLSGTRRNLLHEFSRITNSPNDLQPYLSQTMMSG
jgi:hypothetical protein